MNEFAQPGRGLTIDGAEIVQADRLGDLLRKIEAKRREEVAKRSDRNRADLDRELDFLVAAAAHPLVLVRTGRVRREKLRRAERLIDKAPTVKTDRKVARPVHDIAEPIATRRQVLEDFPVGILDLKAELSAIRISFHRSEERRVGKECR